MSDKEGEKKRDEKTFWGQLKDPTSAVLISIMSFAITLPIVVSLYPVIPPIRIGFFDGARIDFLLTSLVCFVLFYVLIKKFSKFFIYAFSLGLVGLAASSFLGKYSFVDLYYDYSAIYFSYTEDFREFTFNEKNASAEYNQRIINAVDYRNERVKNAANAMAVANFQEYKGSFPSLKILQCFSIFKEVRNKWNYVYDPKGDEYYSKTSVTLLQLQDDNKFKGDCDDYSILIAGLFTAVGGEVRLVRTVVETKTRTIGHLYPELLIGNVKDLEKISYFIKNELFVMESMDKPIYYYQDLEGNIWLNMDYNDYYPGGKYQSYVRKAVITINPQ
ncbi:hypothetical protein [Parvicella tangerina]|uniref:Transglutaminase domain-containing protein n=1 Tax=Parvicella tangerina TaxID=2829795 RepID=A0A916NHA4_9FLAO|nr:hypothetical protein [Parvicella tangerina]CAG5081154.1 hypothetical protein CRYO30217_01550 [Parvicella tangerina]